MAENTIPIAGLTHQLAGRLFKRDLDIQKHQLCLIIKQLHRVIAYYRKPPGLDQGCPCPT